MEITLGITELVYMIGEGRVGKSKEKSKGEQQREGIYVTLTANIEKKKIGWKNKMNWFKIYTLREASMHHDLDFSEFGEIENKDRAVFL